MPAGGTCRTRKPVDGPSAAMPPVRRTRHTQSRPASEARPSARCTAPPSRTAPQTPEARPSDPSRPIGHATVGRDDEQEHSENLCYLDRDTILSGKTPPLKWGLRKDLPVFQG